MMNDSITPEEIKKVCEWYCKNGSEKAPEHYLVYLKSIKDVMMKLFCDAECSKYHNEVKEAFTAILQMEKEMAEILNP